MKKLIMLALAVSVLIGCASVISTSDYKTYILNAPVTVPVGMPFLESQNGTVATVKRWVGVANSPDGWGVFNEYSPDYVRKELIYSGRSGDVIDVAYREFRGNLAAPAFFQAIKYDLSTSDILQFQNFRFRVESADNSNITVVILSD